MSETARARPGARRNAHRFRPIVHAAELEPRILLTSAAPLAIRNRQALVARLVPRSAAGARPAAHHRVLRATPTAVINAQYAAFTQDFTRVEQAYLESLNNSSNNTISVNAVLTSAYSSGSVLMTVDNASVFGPSGTFATPVVATASFNGIAVGTFVLTGRVGNTLAIDPALSSAVNLSPGVILSANIQSSSQTSASEIFPSFIVTRTQLMGINLVNYFNGLPNKLPAFNAPPHTPIQRGAIQSYVYQQVAGAPPTSLQQSLLMIPLPTTTGPDFTIYNAAVISAIEQSRQRVLGGVRQIYSGRLRVPAPAPANRLGIQASGGTASGGTASTGTTA